MSCFRECGCPYLFLSGWLSSSSTGQLEISLWRPWMESAQPLVAPTCPLWKVQFGLAQKPVFKAIAAVVDQPRITEASSGNFLTTMVAGAASWLMAAFAKVITAFILILAGVIMVATVIMGFISVQLVLLLAPVMVPLLHVQADVLAV